jgi:D-sedoheptulose 7-phosphate isomerase
MLEYVKANLTEAHEALEALLSNEQTQNQIVNAGAMLTDCFRNGGHVYACGNGGSMCDAMHFAEELAGRFRLNRSALGAIAMSDGAYMSCVANDFGYDQVFSRFIAAHGRPGDVMVGISTSGKSANVINAAQEAKKRDVKVITLTGKKDTALGELSDIDICTPGGRFADRVQELHIKVIHTLIELVERDMFPEVYR